ncbi:1256_t:CDS:2, partial [Funneliformis geosporum]
MTSAELVTLLKWVVKESIPACKSVTSGNKSFAETSLVKSFMLLILFEYHLIDVEVGSRFFDVDFVEVEFIEVEIEVGSKFVEVEFVEVDYVEVELVGKVGLKERFEVDFVEKKVEKKSSEFKLIETVETLEIIMRKCSTKAHCYYDKCNGRLVDARIKKAHEKKLKLHSVSSLNPIVKTNLHVIIPPTIIPEAHKPHSSAITLEVEPSLSIITLMYENHDNGDITNEYIRDNVYIDDDIYSSENSENSINAYDRTIAKYGYIEFSNSPELVYTVASIKQQLYNMFQQPGFEESLRFKAENILILGILPGPNEVSLHRINYYLLPLITELETLWNRVTLIQTHEYPNGKNIRAVVIIASYDIPAA